MPGGFALIRLQYDFVFCHLINVRGCSCPFAVFCLFALVIHVRHVHYLYTSLRFVLERIFISSFNIFFKSSGTQVRTPSYIDYSGILAFGELVKFFLPNFKTALSERLCLSA